MALSLAVPFCLLRRDGAHPEQANEPDQIPTRPSGLD